MKHLSAALLLAVAALSSAAPAQAPFLGTWKLNPSKSHLTNETTTFEKTPSGDYRFEKGGFFYYFRLDNKEYPTPAGGTVAWRALSADTFEDSYRINGKITATYKGTVKGDTLSEVMTMRQTHGKDLSQTLTFKRISGGPGLPGQWQSTEVNAAATGLELTARGMDGLFMKYSELRSECAGKFDGKQYPMTGEGDGSKATMAFRRMGPTSFEATSFLDGKPIYVDVFTVSSDGKVLTDEGTPTSKKEPTIAVYERE
jgi:hypothetical protein